MKVAAELLALYHVLHSLCCSLGALACSILVFPSAQMHPLAVLGPETTMGGGPACKLECEMLLTVQSLWSLDDLSLETMSDLRLGGLRAWMCEAAQNQDCPQPHFRKQMAAEQEYAPPQKVVEQGRRQLARNGSLLCNKAAPAVEYARHAHFRSEFLIRPYSLTVFVQMSLRMLAGEAPEPLLLQQPLHSPSA